MPIDNSQCLYVVCGSCKCAFYILEISFDNI